MFVAVVLGIAAFIYAVVHWKTKTKQNVKEIDSYTSVHGADAAYLASRLSPDSTHLDVLFCIATTPENIHLSSVQLDKVEDYRLEKLDRKSVV